MPMFDDGPAPVNARQRPAESIIVPEPLDLEFEGWSSDAFAILDRLRAHPHIDQYRDEKPGIREYLKVPFDRYRNDLVVNWVLPNRLDFETEKNVFSRLLKNDFGAGGCKDYLWMSFYRPDRSRLRDVQIAHTLSPDGFDVSLFVGGYATDLLADVKRRIADAPARYCALVNPLLEDGWQLELRRGSGKNRERAFVEAPLSRIPSELERADDIFVRRRFPRDRVLDWGPALVEHTLEAVRTLWPIYRFYLEGQRERRNG